MLVILNISCFYFVSFLYYFYDNVYFYLMNFNYYRFYLMYYFMIRILMFLSVLKVFKVNLKTIDVIIVFVVFTIWCKVTEVSARTRIKSDIRKEFTVIDTYNFDTLCISFLIPFILFC